MTIRTCLSAFGICLIVGCGSARETTTPSIASTTSGLIHGHSCGSDEAPGALNMIADFELVLNGSSSPIHLRSPYCTGALIAPDVVLTAAHCVDVHRLQVTLGQFGHILATSRYATQVPDIGYLLTQPGAPLPADAIPVKDFVAHPEYRDGEPTSGLGNTRDVALAYLARPFSGAVVAQVLNSDEAKQLAVGLDVTLAGAGLRVLPSSPNAATELGLLQCARIRVDELGAFEFRLGRDATSPNACQGDSGGPAYAEIQTPNGPAKRLIGVTSGSYSSTPLCASGSREMRADVFLSWIQNEMKKSRWDLWEEGELRGPKAPL